MNAVNPTINITAWSSIKDPRAARIDPLVFIGEGVDAEVSRLLLGFVSVMDVALVGLVLGLLDAAEIATEVTVLIGVALVTELTVLAKVTVFPDEVWALPRRAA
jgi:hypothetical protein